MTPLAGVLGPHAPLLDRLAGTAPLPLSDPFWRVRYNGSSAHADKTPRAALLALPEPLAKYAPAEVEQLLQPVCASLATHNGSTLHLQKLLLYTAQLLLSAAKGDVQAASLGSGLRLVSVLLKFAAEHLEPGKLLALLVEPALGGPAPGHALAHFVSTALEFLTAVPVTDATLVLHVDACCALQAALATQATRALPHSPAEHPAAAAAASHASAGCCVARLLARVADRTPLPRGAALHPYHAPARGLLRASLAPVSLLLGARPPPSLRSPAAPLADAALLLLGPLLLWPDSPFRVALSELEEGSAPSAPSDAEAGRPAHCVAFPRLLQGLAAALARGAEAAEAPGAAGGPAAEGCADAAVLLLHTLLLHSPACVEALIGDAALPPQLLFQLLRRAHRAGSLPDGGCLLATLLLQLSALPQPFHAACASARAPAPPGPSERPPQGADLALGSLLVVQLCRMATAAAPKPGKPGDPFVLTAALGALVNCAAHASQLSAGASARLVALAALLGRRAAAAADDAAPEGAAALVAEALRDALQGRGSAPSPELVYAALRGWDGLSAAQASAPAGSARAALATEVDATLSWFSHRLDAEESTGAALPVAVPQAPAVRIWNAVDALARVAAHCRAFAASAHDLAPARVFALEAAPPAALLPRAWAAAVTAQHPAPWHGLSLELLLAPA